ncbi:MAG: putative glycoside hydrolase [Candidatus Hydrothermales bacterium]
MIDSLFFALYLNSHLATKYSYLNKIFEYKEKGIIDGVVIDVKEAGFIFYKTCNRVAIESNIVRPFYGDLKEYVKKLKEKNIKPIARFVCFVEFDLAKSKPEWFLKDKKTNKPWKDERSAFWLNPYNKEVQHYLIDLLKELKESGFEEIHLDYIRFPSEGDLNSILIEKNSKLEKKEIISEFLKEVKDSLGGITITACVFGFVCYWGEVKREGQNLKLMAKYLDKFAFMLYPSHFGKNFFHVERDTKDFFGREFLIYAIGPQRVKGEINTKISVYVQSFDLRSPNFGKDYIKTQIKGAYLTGVKEFYFWNPQGNYEETAQAIKEFKEELKYSNSKKIKFSRKELNISLP